MYFRDGDEYNNAEAGSYKVLLNREEKKGIAGLIMNVSYEKQDTSYLVYVFAGHEDYCELLNMVDSTNISCVYADIKAEIKNYIKYHLEEWRGKMEALVAEDLRPKSYVDDTAAFYDLVIANKGKYALVLFFATPFWTKLQRKNGQLCMSKMDNVASGFPGITRHRENPIADWLSVL